MNDHQLRICGQMAKRLERYSAISKSPGSLANDLIGMLDAGDFKDDAFRQEWMQHWGEIEIAAATDSAEMQSEPIEEEVRRFKEFLKYVQSGEIES